MSEVTRDEFNSLMDRVKDLESNAKTTIKDVAEINIKINNIDVNMREMKESIKEVKDSLDLYVKSQLEKPNIFWNSVMVGVITFVCTGAIGLMITYLAK